MVCGVPGARPTVLEREDHDPLLRAHRRIGSAHVCQLESSADSAPAQKYSRLPLDAFKAPQSFSDQKARCPFGSSTPSGFMGALVCNSLVRGVQSGTTKISINIPRRSSPRRKLF
jgi:hypothetical protein